MNTFYKGVLVFTGVFFACNADAQNVRAVQTSTNPQAKQINNSPVIVIPKSDAAPQQNNVKERQPGNPNRSCRKVGNQKGDGRKKQVSKPAR